MKKFYFLTILSVLILFLSGCSEKAKIDGNWETISISMNGEQLNVLPSNMKFVPNENNYKVKGCAGVNLYYADVEVSKKNFKAYGMMNSGFSGNSDGMDFENNFFAALMFGESYKIEGDILTIYAPSKDMEIQLKRKVENKTE